MKLYNQAYAKINWSLKICGKRPDGYHLLDMLMQPLDLCDTLVFESSRFLTLKIENQYLPADDKNLVIQAAKALNDIAGTRKGAHITLRKMIPTRAGLGGGSADCAATLITLNKLWNLNFSLNTLQRVGLKLGADVPFCLAGGLCRVQGIGEILTPLEKAPVYPLVLVTPGGGLSTPQVFKALEGLPDTQMDNLELARCLSDGNIREAAQIARNDLEAPAFRLLPEIAAQMEAFRQMGALYTRMSGSGSTVFAVFADDEQAAECARKTPGAILTHTRG